ncbi:MAG: hypothetical protein JST86_11640 [Bacteroidetes bacterium]|nr:hypothetical protein [Bacteroidota bacterium]
MFAKLMAGCFLTYLFLITAVLVRKKLSSPFRYLILTTLGASLFIVWRYIDDYNQWGFTITAAYFDMVLFIASGIFYCFLKNG